MPTTSPVDLASRLRADQRPAVLVVDDNRANRVAMVALLSSLSVDLVLASSGEEALKQILTRDFAIVLMDIKMPGLDGFETTALIRQRDQNRYTPIIFVTAIFTDKDSAHRAYELGAVDYMTKPLDDTILKAKVEALTNHYRQLHVIERQAAALKQKEEEAARERANREHAEAQNRAKDDFLAVISHELRAPLTALIGWSSRLRERSDLPADVAQSLDTIARNAKSQKKLIDDLLDLSEIVAEKIRIAHDTVDLAFIAQSALATVGPDAAAKRIRLDYDVTPNRYSVVGDARRLAQLIGALLSNAIKFSSEDAVVRIELSRDGRGVRLRVKDSGLGIREDLIPHVFERFRQGDTSWTRRHGGLGIGLTIAQHLARLHGGIVEAFSAGEGAGAVFVLTLPPADGLAHSVDPLAPSVSVGVTTAALPLGGFRLLVVDDYADTLESLAIVLEDAGAFVMTASSAAEALDHFAAHRFDILISDLGMPGEDGLTLMRKIRALAFAGSGTLRAVAVSGYGSDEDREESARAGFDEHLTKPTDAGHLIATLARLRQCP